MVTNGHDSPARCPGYLQTEAVLPLPAPRPSGEALPCSLCLESALALREVLRDVPSGHEGGIPQSV